MPALASGNAAELRANLVAIKAEIIRHKNEFCILENRTRGRGAPSFPFEIMQKILALAP
jgi:hypothetical protein